MKTILLGLALALAATGASAQTVFTSVSVDGHKTFSDRPALATEPAADDAQAPAARRTPAGTMAKGSRGAVLVNANEAQRRLAQAQAKRELGMAPLPGEQIRTGGSNALTYRYWKRQESLRLQVEQAQRRLNATRQPQLAQR